MRSARQMLAAALILPASLVADDRSSWCGTSREGTRAIEGFVQRAERHPTLDAAARTVHIAGDVLVVPPDDVLTPARHPADLESSSIVLARVGASSFSVQRTSLQYEEDIGSPFAASGMSYRLSRFSFPFGDRSLRELWISDRIGIFPSPALPATAGQSTVLEVATRREAVIAPFLLGLMLGELRSSRREIHLRETSDALFVTWRLTGEASLFNEPLLDIQAVLRANGDIRFSYRTVRDVMWGTVIVSTGDELQRLPTTLLGAVEDAAGDAAGSNAALDIRRVELIRVAGSELIDIRVKLGGSRPPSSVAHSIIVRASQRGEAVEFNANVRANERYFCVPRQGCFRSAENPQYTNDSVVFTVLDRLIPFSGSVDVEVRSEVIGSVVDTAFLQFDLAHGKPADTDFSSIDVPLPLAMPLFESFTVPAVNLDEIWRRLRSELQLRDADVDAIAVFQNFQTDIALFAHAYAYTGNAGVDGIWANRSDTYGSRLPMTPTLIHMNRLRLDRNDIDALRAKTLLLAHEFGHRWLYNFGAPYNYDEYHPNASAHLPAAYPVLTEFDSSVMGGGFYTAVSGGTTFRTPPATSSAGYSWHELYLMGLAAPQEVAPWFYLAGVTLDDSNFAPGGMMVIATRVEATVANIVGLVGPRVPEFADSQKSFRVLFVLLQEASVRNVEEERVLAEQARAFREYFAAATGGRGAIVSSLPTPHPRRRPAARSH